MTITQIQAIADVLQALEGLDHAKKLWVIDSVRNHFTFQPTQPINEAVAK